MHRIAHWIGVELTPVSAKEKLVSAAGGFIAIWVIIAVSRHALQLDGAALLIASMGASAVLLFAAPHGQLSQPWPVVGGHLISATIGVCCARSIADPQLAAGCAVGIAIGVMHQLKCIHPPGGATALTAVIGGPAVHNLGYSFVWCPVLVNALAIVVVAIAFNWSFDWRRYPAVLNPVKSLPPHKPEISHESVVAALQTLDSFVDITEEDLVQLVQILSQPQFADSTDTDDAQRKRSQRIRSRTPA
jgi:CBS-domain-containing membrane protein